MKNFTFKKYFALLIAFLGVIGFGYGQTTLSKEDIAIIGVNTDNEDFTFLLRTDITTGTQIYFSDNEVNATGTGLLDTNEGLVLFTALSDYSCGTVLGFISNSSEFTVIDNTFALANGGDEVLAFQGYNSVTDEWTTFLHANVDDTLANLPLGFTSSDIVDGTQENREYNGSTANPTWTDLNSIANYDQANNYSSVTLNTTAFVCVTCSSPTVTWTAGAWSPLSGPTINTPVIISDNYDTGNGGSEVSFRACSLTIDSGARLTVENGDFVEVANDVTVDGQLFVETQGSFVQNNNGALFNDNSINGVRVRKSKTMQNWYSYTYWSSPVSGETIESTFGVTPADRRFRFEAANFVDLQTEIGNSNVFVAGPDDIDDDGNDWVSFSSGTMIPGVGYATTGAEIVGPGGYPITENYDFYGPLNNGTTIIPLINNSGGAYYDWNLVGNPYASAIDVDQFFTINNGLVDVIYLWDQATPPSANSGGSQQSNFSNDDYAIINAGTGEIGARGDTGIVPTRHIPSGQGFFVEALVAGNLIFNNSMRITGNNTQFFRTNNGKKSSFNFDQNKLWINLSSDNGISNQILIGYVDGASANDDGSYYDTPRILSPNVAAIVYSNIENSSKKFAIQGKAPSDLNENEIIDLGFKTAIDVPTVYTFSIAQFQGDFLNNNHVFLIDNLLNKTHNLKVCDYTFTSEVGEFNSRFQIAFSDKALSTNDFGLNDNALKIIELDNDRVNFKLSDNLKIKSVTIYDLLGRQLYNLKGNNSSETYKLSNLKNTVYIAKVELLNGAIITKKAIKR